MVHLTKYWFLNSDRIEVKRSKEFLILKTLIIVLILYSKRILFYILGIEEW